MDAKEIQLPDTVEELKEFALNLISNHNKIISENESTINQIISENESKINQIISKNESKINELTSHYESEIKRLHAKIGAFFAPKKERFVDDNSEQQYLFNESELCASEDPEKAEALADKDTDANNESITIKEHTRKKGGKRKLPDCLPTREIIHDLSDEDKQCPCCKKTRPIIGEERSEELEIIPEKVEKVVHIQKKYGACSCENFTGENHKEVVTSPKPARFIPYSFASASMVAYNINYKFNYGMPFYRLERKYDDLGIDMSRQTLCNHTMLAAEKCKPLYDLILAEIKTEKVINMDETRIQVLKEEGRAAELLSQMWAIKSPAKKLVFFHYNVSRSSEVPLKLLKDFKGYVQTDGYDGYNKAVEEYDLVHVACMAHIRRKFHEAYKANKDSNLAKTGLTFCNRIYSAENELRKKKFSPEKFVEERKKKIIPILDEFKSWLDKSFPIALPSSDPAKAIRYALGEWSRLLNFLEHSDLTPDNNSIENAIRPFALGRKNWLFANTPRGADASAIMYTLVESAKSNELVVFEYLNYIFTMIPQIDTGNVEQLRKFLPCNLKQSDLKI